MKARRGRCRWCGHTYSLTKAGRLRAHNARGTLDRCDGSGSVPS